MSRKLKTKQLRAIALLASGITGVEVARQLKLRPETLSRWKKNPAFAAKLEQVMDDIREDFRHRLVHLVDSSISTVNYGMESHYCDPRRFKVALSVLKLLGIERELLPNDPKRSETASKHSD